MDFSLNIVIFLYACSLLAIIWAIFNTFAITKINFQNQSHTEALLSTKKIEDIVKIGSRIQQGASSFLTAEYSIMGIFIVAFSVVVFFLVDFYGTKLDGFHCYCTVAFIVGAITSIACGFIGMKIAVASNYRTTYMATSSLSDAFQVAYRAGCVMGFSSTGISLGVMLSLLLIFTK